MNENEAPVLRPLSPADIVDETIDLYRANFVLFITISAAFLVPIYVVSYIIGYLLNPLVPSWVIEMSSVESLIATPFTLIAGTVTTAALTYAISRRYLAKEITATESYKVTVNRLAAIIFTSLLVWLIAGIGYIVGLASMGGGTLVMFFNEIVGFAIIGVGFVILLAGFVWSLACLPFVTISTPALMIEGCAYFANVKRSWKLASGKRLQYIAVVVIALIIAGVASFPATVVGELLTGRNVAFSVLAGLLTGLISAITLPLTLIPAVLIYFDARVRDEGYDILILAREAGYETSGTDPI